MHSPTLLAGLLTTLVVAVEPGHAGECALRGLNPHVATPEGAMVPKAGGVVVFESLAVPAQAAMIGPIKDWQLVDGTRRSAPRIRTLAPGLFVLDGAGDSLVNKRGKLRTFRRGDVPAVASPVATGVVNTKRNLGVA